MASRRRCRAGVGPLRDTSDDRSNGRPRRQDHRGGGDQPDGDGYRGTGEASLVVEWQIYSDKTKATACTTGRTGFVAIDTSTPGVSRELIQRAFALSVRGLLVDPGFRAVGGGT